MRTLLLLILCFLTLRAENSILLNTHIRMIPKIMALDTQHASKNTKAVLAIVYDGNQKIKAQSIAEEINRYHNGKVSNLSFSASALSVDEVMKRRDIAMAYLTSMKDSSVSQIAQWGVANSVPTFSYDVTDLELGILGSIVIERTTIIYINKNVLKSGKIRFNDTLFQISRLIE